MHSGPVSQISHVATALVETITFRAPGRSEVRGRAACGVDVGLANRYRATGRGARCMVDLPSGTVTFLLTDVEGSTALWEQADEAMRVALARHDVLFDDAVAQHDGVHI